MYTIDLPATDRFSAYGALDIETDGLDGATDRLVAIGVGYHDGAGDPEVEVHTLSAARGDEAALVETAFAWLDRRAPEGLVTYNGTEFDLPFLRARLGALGVEALPGLSGRHVDLFTERKRLAAVDGEKWPRLEECLEAYGLPVVETDWEGEPLTNVRFGEELAPRYLRALSGLEFDRVRALEAVIREYASADVEATVALYEADAGRSWVATSVE